MRVYKGGLLGPRETPQSTQLSLLHSPPSGSPVMAFKALLSIVSIVAAIPTFIIGIVYMTLVSSDNPTRMWFMQPMWTGNVSRAEWALFFLATPVMFYSAGMFHRRSLKEIYALWRRGSRVPVWKRFIRFGSMNLLVREFAGSTLPAIAHLS